MASLAFLNILENNVAAHSSILGIVNCLSGATLEVELNNSQDVLFFLSVERMYRQAQ